MKKNLVLYFSVYGTARKVAEEIGKQTGADVVEIEPLHPYDSDRNHYNALPGTPKRSMTITCVLQSRIPLIWKDMRTFSLGIPCGGTPSR